MFSDRWDIAHFGFRVLGFRYDEAQRAIDRALSLSPT